MNKTTVNNQQKWDELVRLEVPCSRPYEALTTEKAAKQLNPDNILGELTGKHILCLASGGGQQSIGFTMLGAYVTVVDFSEEQLKKDRQEAKKHIASIRIVQSDMRDLSQFKNEEFDIIYQPYSINYIPEVQKIFNEVARVLKLGGIYHLMFHNPFVHGSWKDSCWGNRWKKEELWNGKGYPISLPYRDGESIKVADQTWNFENLSGKEIKAKAPQEFKHTLSTIINSLIERGFSIMKLKEYIGSDFEAEPGTWEHYITVAPPWLFLWLRKISLRHKL